MRYPKLRELREALKSAFSKPYTTKYPKEPHEPFAKFRGKPEYFDEYCVGCGACAEVCPGGAIQVIDPKEPVTEKNPLRKIELKYDSCIFCGNCERNCITEKGIQLTTQYDLALFDRKLAVESIEKELVICEVCNSIVTTKEHLLWLSKKLGTLAYGNPNLILISNDIVHSGAERDSDTELRRTDIMKILCPKCRHEMAIKDIWE